MHGEQVKLTTGVACGAGGSWQTVGGFEEEEEDGEEEDEEDEARGGGSARGWGKGMSSSSDRGSRKDSEDSEGSK